jgi:hypothetical protein
MAVGVLPGQVNGLSGRHPKLFVDSDTDSTSPTLHTPPSPLDAIHSKWHQSIKREVMGH